MPAKGRFRFTDDLRDVFIDTGDSQRLANYRELFIQRQHRIASVAKKLGLVFIGCKTTEDPLQILKYPLRHK